MLRVGEARLASMVTRESVERLALSPGLVVWAMIKSVAVDSRNPEFTEPPQRHGA
ncbi:TOBE domain-containing protein [Ancylobacter dichloromethanicus]